MPSTVLGNRTAAEFQLSIRASEHFGVLGAMEYDYCAGLPRLPVLQSMGLQKSESLFELTIGISSSRTLAFHRVVSGLPHGLGFCVFLWYRNNKHKFPLSFRKSPRCESAIS